MDVMGVVRVYSNPPKTVGHDERAMILWLGGDLQREVIDQVVGISRLIVIGHVWASEQERIG